jgi:hypothetical protein
MEDDDYHHDDGVVDHLDVIGSQSLSLPPVLKLLVTLLLHRPSSLYRCDTYKHCKRYSPVNTPFRTSLMFQLIPCLSPPGFFTRKPVVDLPRSGRGVDGTSVHTTSTDELDRHVHDVLKRKNKFRRVMKGVWAFLKTRE